MGYIVQFIHSTCWLFKFYNGANNHVHLKRWITGLSALPFLIFLVYIGGYPFVVLIGIACICSLWEYYRIVFNADNETLNGVVVWSGYFVGLAVIVAAHIADSESVLVVLAFNLVLVGLMSMFLYKSKPSVVMLSPSRFKGSSIFLYYSLFWCRSDARLMV